MVQLCFHLLSLFFIKFSKENAGNALFLSRKVHCFGSICHLTKILMFYRQKTLKIGALDDDELLANIIGFDLGVVQQATVDDTLNIGLTTA